LKAAVSQLFGIPEVLKLADIEQPLIQDGHDGRAS
jgi:hypothetical protein